DGRYPARPFHCLLHFCAGKSLSAHLQVPHDSIFFLTLDVVETDSHVLSQKSWKDAGIRPAHETVYGGCKVTLAYNEILEQVTLLHYDCNIRPISSASVVRSCPDCPIQSDSTETEYQEAAAELLAKFNAESNQEHLFAILNVTRASFQWVVGPSRSVEFTIHETSCSKSKSGPDVSKCPLLPPETATIGLCKGSVVYSQIEHRKFTRVNCDFFPRQASNTHEENPQSGADSEEGHGHHQREKEQHQQHPRPPHPRHPGPPHPRHPGPPHAHHPGPPHPHHHHHNHSDGHRNLPHHRGSLGRVTVLPRSNSHVSLHSLPKIGAEQWDGSPVPPQEQGPNIDSTLPEIHGISEGALPVGRPDVIIPFPTGFSESDSCPGETRIHIHGLELRQRPVTKPPPQTSQAE
uniref:Fetuin B n=1 Tax=Varanus komodoensis TaxID=61221 RepID=A0A8D2L855_VARKO